MPGQGTIVATGAIGYPPGFASARPETLRALGVEKVMTMTSTYDHRVIQGAESGAFLAEIDRLLRGEDGFYDDVRDSLGLPAAAPRPEAAEAAPAPPRSFPPRPRRPPSRAPWTPTCWRASRPPCRWSAHTAATATWRRGSTRSARRLPGDPALAPERRRASRRS